ncbi:IPT/TIG domain-containing protein [Streptomyces hirsutus]
MTLTGSHFTGTTSVLYGTRRAGEFDLLLSASTTATVTPSGHGPVPVSVTTPGGTRVVHAVSTASHPLPPHRHPPARAGGNTATLTGLGLYTTYEVLFGAQAAAFTVDSDGQLTVTVPAGCLRRSGDDHRTNQGRNRRWGRLHLPRLAVHHCSHPGQRAGGRGQSRRHHRNRVLLHHWGHRRRRALSWRIASDTEIHALLPAGEVGPVDISVITLGGTATAAAGSA